METDQVREGILEGFDLVESGWIVLRSVAAVSLWLLDTRDYKVTGNLEARACR